jgi:hypothetical protein
MNDFPNQCTTTFFLPGNQVYVQALCQQGLIKLPVFDKSISREDLGIIVVCLDVAVVLSLIAALYILEHYENKD